MIGFRGVETSYKPRHGGNRDFFASSEIATMFGYLKASDLTRVLDDDEKGTHIMRTLGGNQNVSIINLVAEYAAYR